MPVVRLVKRNPYGGPQPNVGSRTDALREKIFEELEKQRVWLDKVPMLRSVSLDVKLVTETGAVRVVIIRTESES